jgi:hypothetical protein
MAKAESERGYAGRDRQIGGAMSDKGLGRLEEIAGACIRPAGQPHFHAIAAHLAANIFFT